MQTVHGRFAPSPSGRMHLGNLYSALLSWLSTRSQGGTLVLRMEDLDPDRCRSEYAQTLANDLRWLGLNWDEGYGIGGPNGPYQQSERTRLYTAAFQQLDQLGLVYPCYCTRAERLAASAPHRSDGQALYDGHCAQLDRTQRTHLETMGRRPAWRLRVPKEEVSFPDGHLGPFSQSLVQDCGDFIIRRSDGVFAYQLAVVVDDADMDVTEVVRGRDLLDSTPRQLLLYRLLGLTPPQFCHVPLLLAPDGRRLSKREQDMDMGTLRDRFPPEALIGRLAFLAGLLNRPDPISAAELLPHFSWERVPSGDVTVPDGLF